MEHLPNYVEEAWDRSTSAFLNLDPDQQVEHPSHVDADEHGEHYLEEER